LRGPEPVAPPGTLHPHEIENGIWDPAAQNLHFPYPGLFDFLLRTWYFEEPRVPNFVVRNIVTNTAYGNSRIRDRLPARAARTRFLKLLSPCRRPWNRQEQTTQYPSWFYLAANLTKLM